MIQAETKIRVRYSETDQMKYVYYGNYASYYEVARVETIRETSGYSYKEMEEKGILLPVREFSITYKKPAFYDEVLTIVTTVTELPQLRFTFHHKCYNQNNELLNIGKVSLVFVDEKSGKPTTAPEWFTEKLQKYFNQKELI